MKGHRFGGLSVRAAVATTAPFPAAALCVAALCVVALLAVAAPALATTHYVGGGGYATIQAGINASSSGDTVLVADGTYTGASNRDLNFGGRNIVVMSENGPDNCIIDLGGTTNYRGFIFNSGESASAVVEGFTIQDGFVGYSGGSGGGMLITGSSPTIRGNIIKNMVIQGSNTSPGWALGAGIALIDSDARVIGNTIDNCEVWGHWTGGGGLYCTGGSPLITGNTISNNVSSGDWGYDDRGGGGICSYSSSPTITSNDVNANSADSNQNGGGIFVYGTNASADTVRIVNNVIRDNTGPNGSGGEGGGLYIWESAVPALLTNNVVQTNSTNGLDCRVTQSAIVRNCIFDGNGGAEIALDYMDVDYNWLQGQTYVGGGLNNINGSSITFYPGPLGDYYYDPLHACNNSGNAASSAIGFETASGTVYMDNLTTDAITLDAGTVNMGVHYDRVPLIIYVPDHFTTIQAAIDAAWADDSVCVRAGTYPELINFNGKPIPVFSESGAAATTIDGGSAGHVVTFENSEGSSSVLDGFTVTGGYGAGDGAGIVCDNASPRLRNLIVTGNQATFNGGGIFLYYSSPTIEDVVVTGNQADYGGGMHCWNSHPEVTGCTFTLNTARNGGGIYCNAADPHIANSTISDNTATGSTGVGGKGGGLNLASHSSPDIEYCVIAGNRAQDTDSEGGGMYCASSIIPPTIDHSTFYGNSAVIGAGIMSNTGNITVTNTIVAFNKTGAGIECGTGGSATLSCSDVYNNDGGDWVGCLAGQESTNNNLSSDPIFCDGYNGDFTLSTMSPCSPSNNIACGQVGAMGNGCAPTSYFVNAAGTGDFPTIQAAIDAANGGDMIELADGTYTGTGNRDVYYWGKSVVVRSDSYNPDSVVIDCQGSAMDMHRGFILNQREGSRAHLEAVTVKNAYTTAAGGGMLNQRSDPAILNCKFIDCAASDGGGVFNTVGADATVIDCTFIGCSATNGGGGLRNTANSTTVEDCTFIGNWAHWGGGGMYNYKSSADVTGCVFFENTCDYWGGGLHNDEVESSIAVTGCTFGRNAAPSGGNIYNRNNAAITVDNTIVAYSTQGAGILNEDGASSTLSCTDVWGNAGGDYVGTIAGQESVRNNFSENPHFCDPDAGDYTISNNSPCAAANNPSCGLVGALPVGCGPSVYVVQPDGLGDFPTIIEAVDACADADTIELTNGTFVGVGNRDIDVDGKAIYIRSRSGDPDSCVIDCQGSESQLRGGFLINSGEDASTVLTGIQFINAYAHALDHGAAVRCGNNSSPTIVNCIFAYCQAGAGGGISCYNGAAPTITDCTFYRINGFLGGALGCLDEAEPTISNCTFFRSMPFAISAGTDCSVGVSNTIVSYTSYGSAVTCTDNGAITFSCSDLYGNEGGDWVGCVAGQESVDHNFSQDPLFCDTTLVALTLMDTSPCTEYGNIACGLVGAWPAGCVPVGIEEETIPLVNRLHQNCPNPFNPTTSVAFELKDPSLVTLRVYDAAGRLVRVLVDECLDAGRYRETWDGTNDRGMRVASGVYFCQLIAGSFSDSKKMVLLK